MVITMALREASMLRLYCWSQNQRLVLARRTCTMPDRDSLHHRQYPTFAVLDCRLFVKDRDCNPIPLPNVSIRHVPTVDDQVVFSVELADGHLPDILDTILPRDWYLVYQITADTREFFNPGKPGRMIVLESAQLRYEPPEFTCFMMDRSTGQLHIPEPIFILTARRIRSV